MTRAGAVPTVGGGAGSCGGTYRRLDLLPTFPSREKSEQKSRKQSFGYFSIFGKVTEKKVGKDLCILSIRGKREELLFFFDDQANQREHGVVDHVVIVGIKAFGNERFALIIFYLFNSQ